MALASWCCPVPPVRLAAEFANAGSSLVVSSQSQVHGSSLGSFPMFERAVCSVQFSVHPVPPGHIVKIHTRINDATMFGETSLVCLTSRLATNISNVYSV